MGRQVTDYAQSMQPANNFGYDNQSSLRNPRVMGQAQNIYSASYD